MIYLRKGESNADIAEDEQRQQRHTTPVGPHVVRQQLQIRQRRDTLVYRAVRIGRYGGSRRGVAQVESRGGR